MRKLEEERGEAQLFTVQGYNGRGFYWIEYHRTDNVGGGTILLRDIGAGKLKGLITASNCDTGQLRCYTNQWSLGLSQGKRPDYRTEWLRKLGEVV